MQVYKFRDKTDGNFAFVVAKSFEDAKAFMQTLTSLEFEFLESRPIEQIKSPFILVNNILPF